jgi:hypothetical protein
MNTYDNKCYICNQEFKTKQNVEKHLKEMRCKSELLKDLVKLNDLIKTLTLSANGIIQSNIALGNNNNNSIKIEININPITKLDLSHIPPSDMKTIIENYDRDSEKLNILLGDYIKNMICDTTHPENNVVKYITRKPPIYTSITEDSEGNTISVIKGLKDTCELLTDPILDSLKNKLKECLKEYRRDEDFDFSLYESAFRELKKELNKTTVKRALKGVLKNDILQNIEMKLKLEKRGVGTSTTRKKSVGKGTVGDTHGTVGDAHVTVGEV